MYRLIGGVPIFFCRRSIDQLGPNDNGESCLGFFSVYLSNDLGASIDYTKVILHRLVSPVLFIFGFYREYIDVVLLRELL